MLIVLPGVPTLRDEQRAVTQKGRDAGAIQADIEALVYPCEHRPEVCEGTKRRKRLTYVEWRMRGGKEVTPQLDAAIRRNPDWELLMGPEQVERIPSGVTVELGVPVQVDPQLGISPDDLPDADLGNGVTANCETRLTNGETWVLTFVSLPDSALPLISDGGVWAALREITTRREV